VHFQPCWYIFSLKLPVSLLCFRYELFLSELHTMEMNAWLGDASFFNSSGSAFHFVSHRVVLGNNSSVGLKPKLNVSCILNFVCNRLGIIPSI
jgi:hypothetical protein